MRVQAIIQSTAVTELVAEADDAASARAGIAAQVPDGFELIQVHNAMPRGGRVIATGRIRPSETRTLIGEGADYAAAKATLDAQLPEQWRILAILSVESSA